MLREASVFMTVVRLALAEEDYAAPAAVDVRLTGIWRLVLRCRSVTH
jgi:hypothetical protein